MMRFKFVSSKANLHNLADSTVYLPTFSMWLYHQITQREVGEASIQNIVKQQPSIVHFVEKNHSSNLLLLFTFQKGSDALVKPPTRN